jgi:glutamine synthetase
MPGQALKHNKGMLTLAELTAMVEAGDIDTVIMAFTDMQGRLVGKRASARLFIEDLPRTAQSAATTCSLSMLR